MRKQFRRKDRGSVLVRKKRKGKVKVARRRTLPRRKKIKE